MPDTHRLAAAASPAAAARSADLLAVLAVLVLGGGTALSYYVDALWFDSLGFADVFWKTLQLQAADLHVLRRPRRSSSSTARFSR